MSQEIRRGSRPRGPWPGELLAQWPREGRLRRRGTLLVGVGSERL